MESGSTRVMAALGCLAIVWIATYWLYEPGGRDSQGLAPLPQMGDTPLPAARSGAPAGPRASEQAPPAPARAGADAPPAPQTPSQTPSQTTAPGNPQAAPAAVPAVIPPQFDDYTVRAGETFETIARAKYGSSKLATVIMHANPMKDPKRLRPGDLIRLPRDPNNIQGRPVAAAPGTPAGAGAGAGAGVGATEYIVQSGDTLSGIAKALWGSSKEWRRILEANAGVLPSEDKIRVGMRLRIPPRPAD